MIIHNYFYYLTCKHVRILLDLLEKPLKVGVIGEKRVYNFYKKLGELYTICLTKQYSQNVPIPYLSDCNILIIPFVLNTLNLEEEEVLVSLMYSHSYCFLIDYRVPERNLDIPVFLTNYILSSYFILNFKKNKKFQMFILNNAIEGFIARHQLNPAYRKTSCAGSVSIMLIKSSLL